MVISHVFVCGGVGCWGGFVVTLVYEKRFQPITIPVTGHISIKDPQLFSGFSDNGSTNLPIMQNPNSFPTLFFY